MAYTRGDQPLSTIHNILKMLLSPHSSKMTPHHSTDVAEDVDEPPDQHILHSSPISIDEGLVYVKSPTAVDKKESLLTRALKTSPDLIPSDRPHPPRAYTYSHPYPYHNVSSISTAELTSDGGMTSPSLANSPSPPFPSHLANRPPPMTAKSTGADASESTVEANLGRKRCISFACGRKAEAPKQQQPPQETQPKKADPEPTPPPVQRRTTLKFVCPAREPETKRERPVGGSCARPRPRGSPAPVARKPSPEKATPPVNIPKDDKAVNQNKPRGVPTSGLGEFEDSEATRFHEFASSVDEDDDWLKKAAGYTGKITMDDCMKKENAIRKLGEEAEEEALDEEDEDDDEDDEDVADDDSTIHDFSDDGNESDNEAGFADSDDSDVSDTEFWAPSSTTAATTPQAIDISRVPMDRRNSNTSFDSCTDERQRWSPARSRRMKPQRVRSDTPNLPDSTDFVCGTLDEDHPLEVAYKSCMEQRRISKQVMIPQDIDPSFPTSDPEDQDDEDNDLENDETVLPAKDGDSSRGRAEEQTNIPSPHRSPKRVMSPPPRRQGRSPPKRLRSPPPMKQRSCTNYDGPKEVPAPSSRGVNISELVQRRPMVNRTKSLPRTPNPFFNRAEGRCQWLGISPLEETDSESPRAHTRGPIDIVEGLEKKRQKRKEKFWRQHCRKAAKEQMERRRVPGKGAERMRELGLEVAERCRAYGVGQDAQLVLSV